MSFAEEMTRLRREMDDTQGSRKAMVDRLHRFAAELTRNSAKRISEMRANLETEGERMHTARREFVENNRETVSRMRGAAGVFIQAFRDECANARRGFRNGGAAEKGGGEREARRNDGGGTLQSPKRRRRSRRSASGNRHRAKR